MKNETPLKRIEKYLDEREKMRQLDGRIHGLHSGHETREAELNSEDLRAIIAENARLRQAITRHVEKHRAIRWGYDGDAGSNDLVDALEDALLPNPSGEPRPLEKL